MMDAMNITKMLDELKAEREGVEQAITVLERIAVGRGRRRGRPPAWMSRATSPLAQKTFVRSPEVRARMRAAQRKRRAKQRAAG